MDRVARLSLGVLLVTAACGGSGSGGGLCPDGAVCPDGGANGGSGSNGDNASGPNGGNNASNGENNASNNGGSGDGGDVCAEVKLDATPKTPNVILIVDQSGSMTEPFGSTDRWNGLRDSLLASDGLIAELQDSVRFGLALYTGDETMMICPLLTEVDVALGNLSAIEAVYSAASPAKDTPTGDSVDAIVQGVKDAKLLDGDDPTVFVLATDGEPDTCEVPNPQTGQAEAVAAVENAFKLGIRTYMVAVADEADISQAHLQDMANAGAGVEPGDPDAQSYRVADEDELSTALRSIVEGELSCTVPLKGKITAEDPCVGEVKLDGVRLGCNATNGWRMVTESSIEVTGTACTKLKQGGKLNAKFPCDAAVVTVE